jgi:hypothetical protein
MHTGLPSSLIELAQSIWMLDRIMEGHLIGLYCAESTTLFVLSCLFKTVAGFNVHLQVFSCGTFLPAHPDKQAEDTNRSIPPLI